MLQRLGLAQGLLGDPDLVLLDEPFSGLDPAAQAAMRALVRELRHAGKTVVVSTQRLSEVSQICSHIGILSRGRVVRSGPLKEVLVPRSQVLIKVDQLPDEVAGQLSELHPALRVNGSEVLLPDDAMRVRAAAVRLLLDAGVDVLHLEQRRATLEEVYLETVAS
jgi:ABC-2 type transport system ATP-binding protein